MQQRRFSFAKLFFMVVLGGGLLYGVAVGLNPWSLHIGGRWTPLLTWQGSGELHANGGTDYPLWVSFHPGSHFSHLRVDGQRPTGGLEGWGWLCTSRGVMQKLKLSGTIYGGWSSTDGSLMAFRLLEPTMINVGQKQGFFDLYGRWRGPQLVMDERERVGDTFRSGLRIQHASVTLDWDSYKAFEAVCASVGSRRAHR